MKAIVAVDKNWAIGKDGDQLVYIPADLMRFKELTIGHPVILGQKTLATFPGGQPLKGRRNLILSATPGYTVEGAEVCPTLQAALDTAPEDSFVIGGESVYRALLPYCDIVYATKIDASFPADRYFPNLDEDAEWALLEESEEYEHEGIVYRYLVYGRIKRG